MLSADRQIGAFFDRTVAISGHAKNVSNMIMTELLRLLSETDADLADIALTPEALAQLVALQEKKTINSNTARELFAELFKEGGMPAEIVEKRGLSQVSDESAILEMVDQAISENPKSVDDFLAGKDAALKFLVGQVMRLSKGKADPQLAAAKLRDRIGN